MRSTVVSCVVGGVLATACVLYWLYKKIRSPLYTPGSVAKEAQSSPNFDQTDLHGATTEESWRMPDGIDIHFFPVKEKTTEPVLGIHGGPGIAPEVPWALQEQIPGFYLYHARGCGKSTRPFVRFPTPGMWPGMKILEETLGIGAQIADIERIRRRLGVEKLTIVGHSFGGFIATLYAAEFPQHVQTLVLLTPASCLTLPPPKGSFDLFETMRNALNEQGDAQHIAEYENFVKRYFDFSQLPKATDESLSKLHNECSLHYARASGIELPPTDIAAIGGMAVFAAYLSMGIEHDYAPILQRRLEKSNFPVHIVHGTEDMTPPAESERYIELFPQGNVTSERIAGGHFLQNERRVIELVKTCLSRVSLSE